jgi:RNA polymerase sigma-70 factor (ECF subfamily)
MEIAVTSPSDDDELTTLAERVRGGNSAAFEELASRVRDRVRRWARHVLRDADDAEDIAQIVLVRMHERLDQFEGKSRFGSWLYRITRNVALELRRSDARRSALLARERSVHEHAESNAADAESVDPARLSRALLAHFDALSPRQRQVFELVELRGVSATEAAKQLGIDSSTVRVLLLRARRTIRARMLLHRDALLEDLGS